MLFNVSREGTFANSSIVSTIWNTLLSLLKLLTAIQLPLETKVIDEVYKQVRRRNLLPNI